jgi:hypothetical protein
MIPEAESLLQQSSKQIKESKSELDFDPKNSSSSIRCS